VAVRPVTPWEIALAGRAYGSQPFRGDEANLLPDLVGDPVLDARTSYDLFDEVQTFIKAENFLDTDHETFGLIADPSEVLPRYADPRFLSPGPPLAVFAGVTVHGP
jgi:hypothetical protein